MSDDDSKQLLKEVSFGIEVETFLAGPIGKHLVKRAEEERDAALNKLKVADPSDASVILRLQGEVWRAESVQTWLANIIQAGWTAEDSLKQMEATD